MNRIFILILFVFVCQAMFADDSPKRIALVIGNQNYDEKCGFKPLRTPENDAKTIASILKEKMGFELIEDKAFLNVDRRTLETAINDFLDKCDTTVDIALLYYSGHGVSYEKDDCIIPLDIERRNNSLVNSYSLEEVSKKLERNKPKAGIIIYDACRTNLTDTARLAIKPNVTYPNYEGNDSTSFLSGYAVHYASHLGEKAIEDSIYSVFTDAWINYFYSEKNVLINDVFQQIENYVIARTDGTQTPESKGTITGSFYGSFAKKYSTSEFKPSKEKETKKYSLPLIYTSIGVSIPLSCNIAFGKNFGEHLFGEVGIGSPLKKTKDIYIYNKSYDIVGKQSYSNINLKARLGYYLNFNNKNKDNSKQSIAPVRIGFYGGYNWSIISGNNSEISLSGFNAHSLLAGAQLEYTPIKHLSLYANLEGKIPISKQPSSNYKLIEQYCPEIKDWTNSFGANFGIKINF